MTATVGPIFICGGDMTQGPRDACHNPLHDWPLPSGYVDRSDAAHARLRRGWASRKCRDCGLYGWVEGRSTGNGEKRVTFEEANT